MLNFDLNKRRDNTGLMFFFFFQNNNKFVIFRPLPEDKVEYLEVEIKMNIETDAINKVKEDIEMIESETLKHADFEMEDKSSEENQEDGQVENDKKPESVNEELGNVKKLESLIQEPELDNVTEESKMQEQEDEHRMSSITISEAITFMEAESVMDEVDDNKQLPSILEVHSNKDLETVVAEIDSDKNLSVVEAEINTLECLIEDEVSVATVESEEEELVAEENKTESENIEPEEDSDNNMKLNLEVHSTLNKTEPMLSDANMQIETLRK